MKKYLLLVLGLLLFAVPVQAANKVYVARETAVTFNDTTAATTLGLNALAADTATISDRADLGAGSTAELFNIRAVIEWDSPPAEFETADIYIATSDGTDADGDIGTTAADLTDNDDLKNMMFVGSVIATSATQDKEFVASFNTRITTRYYSVVVHNTSAADTLQATNDLSYVIVTPIPPEIQ